MNIEHNGDLSSSKADILCIIIELRGKKLKHVL